MGVGLSRSSAMKLEIVFLTTVAPISWLALFSLECYFGDDVWTDDSVLVNSPPFPDHRSDNIFWFLQITDLHLSVVDNLSITSALEKFCHDVIRVVEPSLVLVSGDLTHAKYEDGRLSDQFLSEWKAYSDVVQKCNLGQIPWLDIRGNHDNFNVVSFLDKSNFFREYSMSWKNHKSKSYSYLHTTSFGIYNFIGVDVCPNPGPKRPYNFFGVLHLDDLVGLKALAQKPVNHTIWFTHFPSAVISTDHHAFRQLMSTSIAHLCGHLHTLGGLMPSMYGRHPSGHLELELGDFRNSRRFRLMAFDHDLFSFVDVSFGKWPLVLVTNPKDAQFVAPSREPVQRMADSTHIRLLVFSPVNITSISLEIDGQKQITPVAVSGGPLYVSPWQPSIYSVGLHSLKVIAVDASGDSVTYIQPFSLDGTSLPLKMLPQLLLLTDLRSLFRMAFFCLWSCLLSILFMSWIFSTSAERLFFRSLIRSKLIFFSYLLILVYFGIGPWYVGELLTGVYGFVCVHGVYLMGSFIPGSLTYLHGTIQVAFFHIPLLLYLNWALGVSLSYRPRRHSRLMWNSVIVVSLLFQTVWTVLAYPYGYMALVLSPGGTWQLIISLWLIYHVQK